MPLPPVEPLWTHLCALRDAQSPTDPRNDRHWREVARWIEQAFPGRSRDLDEARQETLVTLMRHVPSMRAEGPLQAAKWIGTILRRKRIDAARARRADPIEQALWSERRRDGAPARLEAVEAPPPPVDRGALLEVIATALEHVHRALEETEGNASKRQLRRTQAQAALLRLVLDEDAEAIAAALEHGEPLAKDRIYKWVERGRAVVRLGLDRWAREDDPDAAEVIAVLRGAMNERRADAGVPRPERRKGRGEEEGP